MINPSIAEAMKEAEDWTTIKLVESMTPARARAAEAPRRRAAQTSRPRTCEGADASGSSGAAPPQ